MVWSNDPGWVNGGKLYGVVDRAAAVWGVDRVYQSLNGGCDEYTIEQ